jgi:signal transduction histidine kinase
LEPRVDVLAEEVDVAGLQAELLTFQRSALLGAVCGMLAHEFNNLMTPVLARAQDAVERDDVPAMRKALSVTVTQTQRAIDVTRRLLALARGEPGGDSTCHVAAAFDDATAAIIRPLVKDAIEFRRDVPAELAVRIDALLLTQVLMNLLLNARNALPQRGGRIAVSARKVGEFVEVDVADNGPGLDADRLRDVNPYLARDARLDTTRGPVGVGLATCRFITHLHGGRIEAGRSPEGGCLMRIALPTA